MQRLLDIGVDLADMQLHRGAGDIDIIPGDAQRLADPGAYAEQPHQQQPLWPRRSRFEQRAGEPSGDGAGLGFRLLDRLDP
jgi:hypothetical protein